MHRLPGRAVLSADGSEQRVGAERYLQMYSGVFMHWEGDHSDTRRQRGRRQILRGWEVLSARGDGGSGLSARVL